MKIEDVLLVGFKWMKVKILSIPSFFHTTGNWFPVIGYTLAISGFLSVLNYFNPDVKFEVTRRGHLLSRVNDSTSTVKNIDLDSMKDSQYLNSAVYQDLKEFRKFYSTNNLPLPEISKNRIGYHLFRRIYYPNDLEIAEDHDSTYTWSSYYSDMQALKLISNPRFEAARDSSYLNDRTSSIKSQQNRLNWEDPFSIRMIPISILDNNKTNLINFAEQSFSKIEYYTFLCAMLYSRRVENVFRITNNSEITLEDINIQIPSPVSKLTGTLTNNIVSVKPDYYPSLVYNAIIEENGLVIKIPKMNPLDKLSLRVVTRENEILTSNIVTSFKEVSSINRNKAIKTTLIVFTILIIIQFLLYKEQKRNNRSFSKKKT